MSIPSVNIKVRVQPRASQNQVVGYQGDTLRVRVTAPPEDGKTNAAVVDLLAKCLGIARRQVSIRAGHTSRQKVVAIDSLTLEEVRRRLERGV